jgi:hypothetical protein
MEELKPVHFLAMGRHGPGIVLLVNVRCETWCLKLAKIAIVIYTTYQACKKNRTYSFGLPSLFLARGKHEIDLAVRSWHSILLPSASIEHGNHHNHHHLARRHPAR